MELSMNCLLEGRKREGGGVGGGGKLTGRGMATRVRTGSTRLNGGPAHDRDSVHHRRARPQDGGGNRPLETQGAVGRYRGRAGFPVAAARKTHPAGKGKGRPDRQRKAPWLA